MRKIIQILVGLLTAVGALQALATTPNPLPVQGNLVSIVGPGQPYAGVLIQLQNCSSPVSIYGYSVIVQKAYQIQANSAGLVNSSVWPNDLIDCNGTTGNSQYSLSYIVGGAVQGTPQCYQVVSTQGLWNLNIQQPVACSQTPPGIQDGQFNNLNVQGSLIWDNNNCWTGEWGLPCGGTGATTAAGALANLGGVALAGAAFTGPVSAPGVNNALEASQFVGADNGAKINAAISYSVANSLPCHITLSATGTISTAPNILLGCTLDIYAPQTLAISWPIYHHGIVIDFHGYAITANTGSSPAIDIGKASALVGTPGTVNTSGTSVTWASGPYFSDIDLGDQISIGSGGYNISSVNSATSLTLVASAGTQTGATYSSEEGE